MGKKRVKTIKGEEIKTKVKKRKKVLPKISKGKAYIQSTYNNTIVTITDLGGNVIAWSSAGTCGFKGAKKATPYAASIVAKDVVTKIRDCGLEQLEVYVKGIGSGRESAIRALAGQGLTVTFIQDATPIPHNGCRAPKVRRV